MPLTAPPGATPSPVTSKLVPSGRTTRRRVNSLTVKVPVLSEHMKVQDPNASTAINRRIITAWRAMRRIPMARATVSAAGNPSGMVETASPIPIMTMASVLYPPSAAMMPASNRMATMIAPATV